ncbi:hypothetical protein ACIBEK_06035 [Nocardia fusca]|uniref:hypothetical protein n=1 Tax=Nocardia fusca TaxID=941183 RepID=UPI0037ADE28F
MKSGERLRSQVCTTEIIVIRAAHHDRPVPRLGHGSSAVRHAGQLGQLGLREEGSDVIPPSRMRTTTMGEYQHWRL